MRDSLPLPSPGAVRASVLLVMATFLGACGSDSSVSSPAEPEPSAAVTPGPQVSAAVTPDPTEPPDLSSSSPSAADGASFGVDRASWPEDMAAAQELLAAMPQTFRGEARELMVEGEGAEGGLAGVTYGSERVVVLVSDGYVAGESGSAPQDVGAQRKLASLFGLVYACDMDTYMGTIEPMAEYPGPGYSNANAGAPAWFACRIAGAEGQDDFSAQAVGWTSADQVAWLAVAPDDEAVRALVTAMQEAAP